MSNSMGPNSTGDPKTKSLRLFLSDSALCPLPSDPRKNKIFPWLCYSPTSDLGPILYRFLHFRANLQRGPSSLKRSKNFRPSAVHRPTVRPSDRLTVRPSDRPAVQPSDRPTKKNFPWLCPCRTVRPKKTSPDFAPVRPPFYLITMNIDWNKHFNSVSTSTSSQLRQPPTYSRSSSVPSFRSTLSNLKRGQHYLGTLVAVFRSNRYINPWPCFWI